ncbi:MAG: hypothetical protein KDB73_15660 [Planctomycetes bacterium]|nr:hypothetical protein [Planctomycetota bacterium]
MFEAADPIPLEWDEPEHVESLAAWLYFNPYGPTLMRLSALPLAGNAVLLLRRRHPFAPQAYAIGLADEGTFADARQLADLVGPVFGGGSVVGDNLPTSILLDEKYRLPVAVTKELFWQACAHVNGEDLRGAIELLREHGMDPWAMAGASRDRGLRRAMSEGAGSSEPASSEIQRGDFEAWWDVISDPRHWIAEVREFGNAWRGSIGFARGDFG